MNCRLKLHGLAGRNVFDRGPTIADADLVFIEQIQVETEVGNLLVPQIVGGRLDQIVVLPASGADFLKFSKRQTNHGRTSGGPIDDLVRRILARGGTNYKNGKEEWRKALGHRNPLPSGTS